jgi:hypothetical protein
MRTDLGTLVRTAVVVGATLVVGVLAAPGAGATSDPIHYTCDYSVGETVGTGSATAIFDSGVDEGLVVPVGEWVSFDPLTGSVTLPQEFTDALREEGVSSIRGAGSIFLAVREPMDKLGEATFEFDTELPAEGLFTVPVSGVAGEYQPQNAGTYTLVTLAELFFYLDPEGQAGDSGVTCTPDNDGDTAIDVFTATGAATPTTTVTTTATAAAPPVRPVVVQTDFADDEVAPLSLTVLLGTGLLALGGAAGARWTGRHSASRRH